ncbi:hypothetical protein [Paraburkholderia unamae]|uniref:RecA/RadA family phage recombinase n=1 Tax=Paraburkholderia unamae TaxID=219649 RepID=A0ABX5KJM0_9BURK|nr:hypothetical protein [Paraburkholderia unamae]PVX80047.1 hypothetical protein C7402_112234 [Paraburkholderia unamae]
MTATTADRNTPLKDGEIVAVPVAANAVIRAGVLVCADANGNAIEGKTAEGLTYLGRSEVSVDNTGGAAGAISVYVRRGLLFQWANAADDPVTQASFGKLCYVEDNQTVAATNGTNTRSAAGLVFGVDAGGVWVL